MPFNALESDYTPNEGFTYSVKGGGFGAGAEKGAYKPLYPLCCKAAGCREPTATGEGLCFFHMGVPAFRRDALTRRLGEPRMRFLIHCLKLAEGLGFGERIKDPEGSDTMVDAKDLLAYAVMTASVLGLDMKVFTPFEGEGDRHAASRLMIVLKRLVLEKTELETLAQPDREARRGHRMPAFVASAHGLDLERIRKEEALKTLESEGAL